MLRDSVREFALAKLRPVAADADDACEMPAELLSAANELGLSMVGVPEQLGGAVEERSAVTSVLMSEPRALFDPFKLQTRARAREGGYILDGAKSLVPRAADGELFIVAAELEGRGPALFVVESKAGGIAVEAQPAMGIRAAGTGLLTF